MIMFSFQELSSKPDMKCNFNTQVEDPYIYIEKERTYSVSLCVCFFKKLYLNYIQMKVVTEQHQISMIG